MPDGNHVTAITGSDNATTWRIEATWRGGEIATIWVSCLHWPGCDDRRGHAPVSLGVGRRGKSSPMLVANRSFWALHGIIWRPIVDGVARAMSSGDLRDVARTGRLTVDKGEL